MDQSESNNETLLVTPSPTSPQERDVFPEGLRVLAVDDNSVCLALLEKLLCKCKYEVETASDASKTLKLLKEKSFDIVIIDVHMPNKSDGFKLLEIIGLQMDIPIVMMSADDDKDIVLKAIEHGACDYLVKPVRMQEVKNIWQHVIRKSKTKYSGKKLSNAKETRNVAKKAIKREREEDDYDDDDDSNEIVVPKKPRFSWTQERHSRFIAIVSELGVDNAAPSKILEKMGIPGLTRQQVASHLQKFRSGIKKTRGHDSYGSVISTVMNEELGFNSQEMIHHFGNQVDRLNNLVHAFPQRLQAYQLSQMNQAPMFGHVPQHPYVDLYTTRSVHPYPIFGSGSSSSSRPFGAAEFVDQSCRELMGVSPDHTLPSFDHIFEGASERENIENLDMQSLDENFMTEDHNLMDEHPIDDLETEYLMQHNSSSSPDEDLEAIVKHHLQTPP